MHAPQTLLMLRSDGACHVQPGDGKEALPRAQSRPAAPARPGTWSTRPAACRSSQSPAGPPHTPCASLPALALRSASGKRSRQSHGSAPPGDPPCLQACSTPARVMHAHTGPPLPVDAPSSTCSDVVDLVPLPLPEVPALTPKRQPLKPTGVRLQASRLQCSAVC